MIELDHLKNPSDLLLFLKTLRGSSARHHLQRLVLFDNEPGVSVNPTTLDKDCLVPFITEMGSLVALCLAGFRLDPYDTEVVNQQISNKILPLRPAFWLYLGLNLPKGNNTDVPRVHYDEIIRPIDWFRSPPPSLLEFR